MRKQRPKTMKQMRSMTVAAISHSLIICWSLSLWSRCWSSRRSLVSIMSLIDANRRSTGPLLCPAAAADDDDDVRTRCLVNKPTLTESSSIFFIVFLSCSFVLVTSMHISDASCSHTTRFSCQHNDKFVLCSQRNRATHSVVKNKFRCWTISVRGFNCWEPGNPQTRPKLVVEIISFFHQNHDLAYFHPNRKKTET